MSVPDMTFLFFSDRRKHFFLVAKLVDFCLSFFLYTHVYVTYLTIYVAPMIATRRERETRFGANDRAMVMPIYFVYIALSQ